MWTPDERIDLHGCRRSEVRFRLLPFLDRGYAQEWEVIHIVHGKGKGVLREHVWEILDDLDYIESYRPGYFYEGGTGTTVVKYRREKP